MSEFEARIKATLDTSEAEKQLKDLTGKEHEVKLKTDIKIDNKSTQKRYRANIRANSEEDEEESNSSRY